MVTAKNPILSGFIAKTIWENEWPVIAPGIGHLEDTVDIPLEECRFVDEISENDFITFCEPKPDKRLVGLVLFQNNENHLRMEITMEDGRLVFVVTTHIKGTDKKIAVADIMEYSRTEKNPLWNISMICKEQEASIWIGTAEKSVKAAEKISLLPYTTEEAGGFVGCTVGMYASSNGIESDNHADFSYIMLT